MLAEVSRGHRLYKGCCRRCYSDYWSLYTDWLISMVLEPFWSMIVGVGLQVISDRVEGVRFGGPTRGSKVVSRVKSKN